MQGTGRRRRAAAARPTAARRANRPLHTGIAAAIVSMVLLVLVSLQIQASQRQARAGLDERLEQRTVLAAQFIESYDRDLTETIASHGRVALSGDVVSATTFTETVTSMRFRAGVLLDERGRLLEVVPENPSMLGEVLTDRYDHLRRAVAGERVISAVVPSAVVGEPIVAFAVPFDTPYGTRVFSAGLSVRDTPLGTFLHNTASIIGQDAHLVDVNGAIVASSDDGAGPTLSGRDPALAGALAVAGEGTYARSGEDVVYLSRPIAGTPWRIVVTVPAAELYQPLESGRWTPWLLLVVLVVIAVGTVLTLIRLERQRGSADRTATEDSLTGLLNRRGTERELRALRARRRPDEPWAVLLLDIDHFKDVNDRYGHQRGDDVLRAVGAILRHAARPGDVVGRWGGEEFVLVLPTADTEGARLVAERVLAAVAGAGTDPPVTVSVGYAATRDGSDDTTTIVARADAALYRAKEAGRNRCETLDDTPATSA